MEKELERRIDRIPSSYPGYDEYRYQLDEMSHNPYSLTSYLTAIFGNFRAQDIQMDLEELFRAQFILTLESVTETRTRVETDTDPETGLSYSYLVEYDWHVLVVKLKNKGLDAIAMERMNEEQKRHYQIYQASLGNREYLFGEEAAVGNVALGGISYEVPPEALADAAFARMIHEAEKYLGYPYVWGGSSPATSFDCSGFVSYVVNHSGNGWNVGRSTANGLLSQCTYVSPSDAKPGDLIFFQGTYNTSGASHVGIYVGNGMMIHCGNPIQYASVNTNYWKNHFLCYGRIR